MAITSKKPHPEALSAEYIERMSKFLADAGEKVLVTDSNEIAQDKKMREEKAKAKAKHFVKDDDEEDIDDASVAMRESLGNNWW